jgi:hypothetical protein
MNRRGFLSSLVGGAAVAALPLASVAAPAVIPAPIAAPPPPVAPAFSPGTELERLTAVTLGRIMRQVGIKPISPPCERARLGSTFLISEPRPFRVLDLDAPYRPGYISPVTLHRQACRGVKVSPFEPPAAEDMGRVVDELAAHIQTDLLHGCRGLVFGVLPDPSQAGSCIREVKFAEVRDASMRAIEYYMVECDQFVVRFDVLWGWKQTPRAWSPSLGGTHLLMV